VRFVMLTKRPESPMDFDFAKVVEQSRDNPVFYVQYAHARIASLGRKLAESGMVLPPADLSLLSGEELGVIKLAASFPRLIEQAAEAREPHRIAFYLNDLAAAFHSRWNAGNDDPQARFLLADRPDLTAARLALAGAVGQVIRNGLAVIGVAAAEELN
jgi:arginyl-tRNA synthetase